MCIPPLPSFYQPLTMIHPCFLLLILLYLSVVLFFCDLFCFFCVAFCCRVLAWFLDWLARRPEGESFLHSFCSISNKEREPRSQAATQPTYPLLHPPICLLGDTGDVWHCTFYLHAFITKLFYAYNCDHHPLLW